MGEGGIRIHYSCLPLHFQVGMGGGCVDPGKLLVLTLPSRNGGGMDPGKLLVLTLPSRNGGGMDPGKLLDLHI